MNQRIAAWVLAGAIVVAPAAFAGSPNEKNASDQKSVAQKTAELQAPILPLTLSAIFARVAQEAKITTGEHGMQIADNPNIEVLVARRNADVTISKACVDSEEAARRFFAKQQAATPGPQEH